MLKLSLRLVLTFMFVQMNMSKEIGLKIIICYCLLKIAPKFLHLGQYVFQSILGGDSLLNLSSRLASVGTLIMVADFLLEYGSLVDLCGITGSFSTCL